MTGTDRFTEPDADPEWGKDYGIEERRADIVKLKNRLETMTDPASIRWAEYNITSLEAEIAEMEAEVPQ